MHADLPPVSADELAAEAGTALPDKEVMSLLDLNADLNLALDVASPIDLAVAANANVAAPINAAVGANILSVGSVDAAAGSPGREHRPGPVRLRRRPRAAAQRHRPDRAGRRHDAPRRRPTGARAGPTRPADADAPP